MSWGVVANRIISIANITNYNTNSKYKGKKIISFIPLYLFVCQNANP